MTDNGSVPRRRSATGNYINNVVLGSSFVQTRPGDVRFVHANPGSALRNIDEMTAPFARNEYWCAVPSEIGWLKKHWSDKSGEYNGLQAAASWLKGWKA
jgi:hypothetical protein